jgi:hypothetical protein
LAHKLKKPRKQAVDEILGKVEGISWRAFRAVGKNFIKNLKEKCTSHLLKNFSMPTKLLYVKCL